MKKALGLLLAVLGVLCFSSVASAEGFTVSADYSFMTVDVEGGGEQDFTSLTLGGEYVTGPFLVGGSYLTALSYDPDPPSNVNYSDNTFCLYAGYRFLDENVSSLALVGGYTRWNSEITFNDMVIDYLGELIYVDSTGTSTKMSLFGLGAKGTVNLEPINVSVLLLYGISNRVESETSIVIDGVEYSEEADPIDDVSAFYFELKGSYQLTDSLGAFALYRSATFSLEGSDITISGFGLGVECRF